MRAGFWWVIVKERDHLEDVSVDSRMTSIFIFTKSDGKT